MAFDQIAGRDWVLHLDADIVMPRQFRRLLEWAHLDERCLYGADRQRLVGWDEWRCFQADTSTAGTTTPTRWATGSTPSTR